MQQPRRPSPQLCLSCLRLHIRLSSAARRERRAQLLEAMSSAPEDIRLYALALFDHLTLSAKASDTDEIQRHRTPAVPIGWGAHGLDLVERSVVRVAFAL